MRRLLHEQPDLIARIFTDDEQQTAQRRRDPAASFAARFAAKEAVLKALGTGLIGRMSWTEVEVFNHAFGRPGVRLHGAVASEFAARGIGVPEVSLSHSAEIAIAHAAVLVG